MRPTQVLKVRYFASKPEVLAESRGVWDDLVKGRPHRKEPSVNMEDVFLCRILMERLSEDQHRVVDLIFFQDKTVGKVAREMHISRNRVASLMAGAFAVMRAEKKASMPAQVSSWFPFGSKVH